MALCIWYLCWTGIHARYCPDAFQLPWMCIFVLRRWKKRSINIGGVLDEKVGNLDEHQYMLYVQLKESIGESHCRNIGELNQAF